MNGSDWCPGTTTETLTPAEQRKGKAPCQRCGRTIKIRKNVNGTVLGMARHKKATR